MKRLTAEQIDEVALNELLDTGQSVNDITATGFRSRRTVVGALKRLLDGGHVTRTWNGNARFGRYLYRIAAA